MTGGGEYDTVLVIALFIVVVEIPYVKDATESEKNDPHDFSA